MGITLSNLWSRAAVGAWLLMIPVAAWADLNDIATLTANSALSLDTLASSRLGGDLQFSGGKLTTQGSAKAFDIGNIRLPGFSASPLIVLMAYAPDLSNLPITAAVGDVIVVLTNGGNYAKILVTTISETAVTLQYLTYAVSNAPAGPAIMGVQNNYS